VIDGNGGDAQMRHLKFLAHGEGDVFHHITVFVLELGEARIDRPVKNIAFEQRDHFFGRVNAHGFGQEREMIVNEDGQRRHVIHVRVCDDHVADSFVLRFGEAEGDASGIDGDAVVDEKTGEPLLLAGAAIWAESAGKELNFHGGSSVLNFALRLLRDVGLPAQLRELPDV
jgi:hypothetical protein